MKLAVCWKWVSLDAEREADPRWSGVSAADEAALEVALRLAGPDDTVRVVALGPKAADTALRDALAAGANEVLRIDAATTLDSEHVAVTLGQHLTGTDLVVCGDASPDRGTGSVPVYLAAELEAAQALGLIEVETTAPLGAAPLRVVRRLDGGRREVLDVTLPAVISVEGSIARLRRASLAASLGVRQTSIPVVLGPHGAPPAAEVHPYRPRPRAVAAPTGDALTRVRALLDIGGSTVRAESVALDPPAAAARIVAQLREWGYLEPHEMG